MKIIFSPSKKQISTIKDSVSGTKPLFNKKSSILVRKMKGFSQKELEKILKISENISKEVFYEYRKFGTQGERLAFTAFEGTSFIGIDRTNLSKRDWEYLQNNLYIFSALYGVLRPADRIRKYRLDMNDNIFPEKNLYKFWENEFEGLFEDNEVILDLASTEYSKMVPKSFRKNIISVDFLVEKDGVRKQVSVFSKQQRGKMLEFCMKEKIDNPILLKKYSSEDFSFDEENSTENRYIYVKRGE